MTTPYPTRRASDRRGQAKADAEIVGMCGCGSVLTAAIFAKTEGATVLLLEKHTEVRGSTGLSIGSITATGTWHQRQKGIVDNPDWHFEDMAKLAGDKAKDDNEELRRILVDNVADSVAWLQGLGVTFYGPMPEPPHRLPRMHTEIGRASCRVRVCQYV